MTRLTVSKFGTPGYVQDVAPYALAPQAFDEVRNVRFTSTGAETFAGEIQVMSQAPIAFVAKSVSAARCANLALRRPAASVCG